MSFVKIRTACSIKCISWKKITTTHFQNIPNNSGFHPPPFPILTQTTKHTKCSTHNRIQHTWNNKTHNRPNTHSTTQFTTHHISHNTTQLNTQHNTNNTAHKQITTQPNTKHNCERGLPINTTPSYPTTSPTHPFPQTSFPNTSSPSLLPPHFFPLTPPPTNQNRWGCNWAEFLLICPDWSSYFLGKFSFSVLIMFQRGFIFGRVDLILELFT